MTITKKVVARTLPSPLKAEGISELVTVANVPMVSTGIDYPTSLGFITFTEQHLQDLIASQDDPAIHPPRTKLGHTDPRFNAKMSPTGEMLDGEPSLGTWMNLRLGDNGQTVYGDLVGVPRWFAAIASTAYPSRSIEGNFDVETVTGHKWSLVVDAVAMLGVIGPGVTTLDDLPVLFSEEGPSGIEVIEPKEGEPMSVIRSSVGSPVVAETVSDTAWSNFSDSDYDDSQYARACIYDRAKCSDDWKNKPAKQRYSLPVREPSGTLNRNGCHAAAGRIGQVTGGCTAAATAAKTTLRNLYTNQLKEDPPSSIAAASTPVAAQANLDDIRRGFYEGLDQSQFWWWIRAIYIDPNELIVDDDEGGLYRVPFTAGGDDEEVTFGDPIPVKIQYVDQPAPKVAAAIRASVAASLGEPATTYQVRAESRPGGCMTPEEAAALRERFSLTPEQLPDDADDATTVRVINQSVAASAPQPNNPEGSSTPEEEQPAQPSTSTEETSTPQRQEAIPSTAEASRIPGSAPPNLPDGTIMVDRATWEEVAQQARQGAELAARTRDEERDKFLDEAIKAGKFPPSRKKHYLDAWKGDPEGTRGLIDSLAAGLVPVEARGTAGTGHDEEVRAAELSSYDQNWLTSAEKQRIRQASEQQVGAAPAVPAVVQGGD